MQPNLEISGTARCTSDGFNTWNIGDVDVVYAVDDADGFSGPVRLELTGNGKTAVHEGLLSVTLPYGWSSWTVEDYASVQIGDIDLMDLLHEYEDQEVALRLWWLEST